MVARWTGAPIGEVAPTFGFKIETVQLGEHQLHLWDIGGQRTIRAFWRNYFEHTDGLVFVVDAAAPHRMDEALAELSSLLSHDRLASASVLILANKQDCPAALPAEQIAQEMMLSEVLGGKTHWRLIGCSAVTELNIHEALGWIVGDIAARLYHKKQ